MGSKPKKHRSLKMLSQKHVAIYEMPAVSTEATSLCNLNMCETPAVYITIYQTDHIVLCYFSAKSNIG